MPEQILWNGQQVLAERVEVLTADERWSEYQLADGTVLRNKAVLTVVWRLCDVRMPDGSPCYVYHTQNVGATALKVTPDAVEQDHLCWHTDHAWACQCAVTGDVQMARCGKPLHSSDCDCGRIGCEE